MHVALILTTALLLGVAPLIAQEWPQLVVAGKEYRDAKLIKVEPDGIRIIHAEGTAKVPFEKLPEDLQKEFKFDADQAVIHRKQQAEDLKKERQAVVRKYNEQSARDRAVMEARESAEKLAKLEYRHMAVQVAKVLENGDLICYRYQTGGAVGETGLALNALRKRRDQVTEVDGYAEYDKPLYITGVKAGIAAEGVVLQGLVAEAGVKKIDGRTLPWWVSRQ